MRQLPFILAGLGLAACAHAQQPASVPPVLAGSEAGAVLQDVPHPVASIGQPARLHWTAALSGGTDGAAFGHVAAGARKDLLNPLMGLAAVHGEAYVQAGREVAPGARLRLVSPFLRVGLGADIRDGEGADLLLTAVHPVRRGGVFRDGSTLRLDYVPSRRSIAIGVEKPVLAGPAPGRVRPYRDRASLPVARAAPHASLPADLEQPLAVVRANAHRVRTLVLPLGPVPAGPPDPHLAAAEVQRLLPVVAGDGAGQVDVESAVRSYHRAVEQAFALAAHDPVVGAALAEAARPILLRHVLLPYNRLLGQLKKPDHVRGLGDRAAAAFDAAVADEAAPGITAPLTAEQRARARSVFLGLVDVIDENRAAESARWRDSRFTWLPLQLALLPGQHDTQAELDAIIEEATGARFTEGNFVSWLVNEQFQYHLSRTIREAEQYHVLWTHDFRGLDAGGAVDEMSYRHVLRSYLAALTDRVRNYDRTGVMPTYMIIIDQWFYEVNHARLWLTLLEDPLHHALALPPAHAAWQDTIAAAQRALRQAVAASPKLQAQARVHGDAWLRNTVKVHVNVTNPADPTFWSGRVVRGVPLPDNMMRDHRKMVFYDVGEDDPYRGEAIFTGAGIGEHYANLSWEDRSLLVRGPALLPLKAVTRELLSAHGIAEARMPAALLPRAFAADYHERVHTAIARNDQPLRALQLHNGAGFHDKQVNVAKAVLYTLMPPGSVLKIPDSLWNSDFWTSALLGCALRGGRVLIVAPAAANAPADAFGTLGRSREVLARLLTAEAVLRPAIEDAGGLLRVGLFHGSHAVTDIPAKVRLVSHAFENEAWLRTLFPFPSSVLTELGEISREIAHLSMALEPAAEFEHDPSPKLHLKANFMASPEAWSLMERPEWADAAWAYMQVRIGQIQDRSAAVRTFATAPDAIADVGGGMVRAWHAALPDPARERVVFYTLMGSHNQNSRSIVIDAEVGFLMSGWPAIIPYIDMIVLLGQTVWLSDADELAAWLPLDTGWRRAMAQWFRLAL